MSLTKLMLVLLTVLLITLDTDIADAKSNSDLKQHLSKAIVEENLAGIVWSTISKEGINVGSAGFSNQNKNKAMLPSQKVHVGSVAKTVLAMGMLRLISEGQLSLNASVEALLPKLAFKNSWGCWATLIKLRLKKLV